MTDYSSYYSTELKSRSSGESNSSSYELDEGARYLGSRTASGRMNNTGAAETGGAGTAAKSEAEWFKTWRLYAVVGGILLFVGLILVAATVPNGFFYVEWNEYALRRGVHPHNSGVKLDKVYTNGRYWTGTGYTKISFPRPIFGFEYGAGSPDGILLGFTAQGLEFSVECSFQVAIVAEQIPLLYSKFPGNYRSRIAALGLRALKNVAVSFSLVEYITRREEIQVAMYTALTAEISSLCGPVECVRIPSAQHFQLRRPIVPAQIHETWLNAAVQIQVNLKQQNDQVRVLVERETLRLQAEIAANITLVNTSAAAESDRIRTSATAAADRVRAEAEAAAFRVREAAKGQGIQSVMSALNITTDADANDMLGLLTVMDSADVTVRELYRRTAVFDDPSTRVILGASNAVVSV